MIDPKSPPWPSPRSDGRPMVPCRSVSLVGFAWTLLAPCWSHREYSKRDAEESEWGEVRQVIMEHIQIGHRKPRCCGRGTGAGERSSLTLSLTVSLIFELALFTAEYKNEPKFLAPWVTLAETVRSENKTKKNDIYYHRIIVRCVLCIGPKQWAAERSPWSPMPRRFLTLVKFMTDFRRVLLFVNIVCSVVSVRDFISSTSERGPAHTRDAATRRHNKN